jgi:hypothetical protein
MTSWLVTFWLSVSGWFFYYLYRYFRTKFFYFCDVRRFLDGFFNKSEFSWVKCKGTVSDYPIRTLALDPTIRILINTEEKRVSILNLVKNMCQANSTVTDKNARQGTGISS